MSEETKWTKGPWSLADENNQTYEVQLGSEHNLTCSLNRQDNNTGKFVIERDEMIANGHLIAAAPDLYEALEAMVSYGREHGHGLRIADEALAKARGEDSNG